MKFPIPIPDSKFFRVFCYECSEPLRVPSSQALQEHLCEKCQGKPYPPYMANLTPRQAAKLSK